MAINSSIKFNWSIIRSLIKPLYLTVVASVVIALTAGLPLFKLWFDQPLSASSVASKKLQVQSDSNALLQKNLESYRQTGF